ncbi:MAG: hypothetical protein AB1746_10330 [Candidatus Zixiibacteriota bacterium]
MFRNILKIFAILVLIGILIGISVIKSKISAKKSNEKMESIKEEYFRTHDSLLLEKLDDTTRVYVDSIRNLEIFYSSRIDSLNKYYAERESLLTVEIEKEKNKNITNAKTSTNDTPAKDTLSPKVKADYEGLVKRLPGDLTAYERRVSIDEIVIELSQQYKISPEKVRKIVGLD